MKVFRNSGKTDCQKLEVMGEDDDDAGGFGKDPKFGTGIQMEVFWACGPKTVDFGQGKDKKETDGC